MIVRIPNDGKESQTIELLVSWLNNWGWTGQILEGIVSEMCIKPYLFTVPIPPRPGLSSSSKTTFLELLARGPTSQVARAIRAGAQWRQLPRKGAELLETSANEVLMHEMDVYFGGAFTALGTLDVLVEMAADDGPLDVFDGLTPTRMVTVFAVVLKRLPETSCLLRRMMHWAPVDEPFLQDTFRHSGFGNIADLFQEEKLARERWSPVRAAWVRAVVCQWSIVHRP